MAEIDDLKTALAEKDQFLDQIEFTTYDHSVSRCFWCGIYQYQHTPGGDIKNMHRPDCWWASTRKAGHE